MSQLRALCAASQGLGKTLHRVVDVLQQPHEDWLQQAIDLGFERVLTSGGAAKAVDGLANIKLLNRIAANRISIMPGSAITAENAPAIVAATGVTEVHASCVSPDRGSADAGFNFGRTLQASAERIAALKNSLIRKGPK